MPNKIERLLLEPIFQNYCASRLRVAGIPVENGNPGETLLSRFYQEAPEMCRAHVEAWITAQEQHYGPAPAEPPPPAPQAPKPPGFWEKSVETDQLVKDFNALPKNSQIRALATAPELDALAVSKGIGVMPGLKTPGESIAAFLLAGSKVDAEAANYAELASLTRGAFGNAEELRNHFATVQGIHGADELAAHRDAMDRERAGGREPEVPKLSKQAQEEAADRAATRGVMSDIWDRVDHAEKAQAQKFAAAPAAKAAPATAPREEDTDSSWRSALESSWDRAAASEGGAAPAEAPSAPEAR